MYLCGASPKTQPESCFAHVRRFSASGGRIMCCHQHLDQPSQVKMPLRPVQDSLSTDSPRLLPLSADDQSVSLPLAAPIQAARPKWLSDASDQPAHRPPPDQQRRHSLPFLLHPGGKDTKSTAQDSLGCGVQWSSGLNAQSAIVSTR